MLEGLRPLLQAGDVVTVACSGGADSLALLLLLKKITPVLAIEVKAVHFHHGDLEDEAMSRYRERASHFVEDVCQRNQISLHIEKSDRGLVTEDECRQFRESYYKGCFDTQISNSRHFFALGHHSDDLLETRLIRLIRGSGSQGLESMAVLRGYKLRPFLEESRVSIEDYVRDCGESWFEDPSNANQSYLRNWLRNIWLQDLEKKYPGGVSSMARSLHLIAESIGDDHGRIFECVENNTLNLVPFWELSLEDKKRVLAYFLRVNAVKGYGQSHIKEVLKRLDNNQKEHTFVLLKKQWLVNAQRIVLEKV